MNLPAATVEMFEKMGKNLADQACQVPQVNKGTAMKVGSVIIIESWGTLIPVTVIKVANGIVFYEKQSGRRGWCHVESVMSPTN